MASLSRLTDRPSADVDIPGEPGSSRSSLPFGILIQAQSLGDRQALLNAGRRVLRIDLGKNSQTQLERAGRIIGDGARVRKEIRCKT